MVADGGYRGKVSPSKTHYVKFGDDIIAVDSCQAFGEDLSYGKPLECMTSVCKGTWYGEGLHEHG